MVTRKKIRLLERKEEGACLCLGIWPASHSFIVLGLSLRLLAVEHREHWNLSWHPHSSEWFSSPVLDKASPNLSSPFPWRLRHHAPATPFLVSTNTSSTSFPLSDLEVYSHCCHVYHSPAHSFPFVLWVGDCSHCLPFLHFPLAERSGRWGVEQKRVWWVEFQGECHLVKPAAVHSAMGVRGKTLKWRFFLSWGDKVMRWW